MTVVAVVLYLGNMELDNQEEGVAILDGDLLKNAYELIGFENVWVRQAILTQ